MPTTPSDHPPHLPTRSIPPSEPRKRAVLAGICATVLGAFIVSAFVRACEGETFFEKAKRQQAQETD